jgi:hypothetical protein
MLSQGAVGNLLPEFIILPLPDGRDSATGCPFDFQRGYAMYRLLVYTNFEQVNFFLD